MSKYLNSGLVIFAALCTNGRVAQWQSSSLLSYLLRVRPPPRSQESLPFGRLFVLLSVPTGGMIFDPSALTRESSVWKAFCFVECPHRGGDIRPPPRSQESLPFGRLFVLLSVPTGGMIFDPLRAHKRVFRLEGFLFC